MLDAAPLAAGEHTGPHAWNYKAACAIAGCPARRCRGRASCTAARLPGRARCATCQAHRHDSGDYAWLEALDAALAAWSRPSPAPRVAIVVRRRRRRRVFDHFGPARPEHSNLT
jgi:hypothetical protein